MTSAYQTMRRAAFILVPIIAVAAALLYIFLDTATATFLLVAGVIVSACAASTTLLGAYTRNKDIAREREREDAETIDQDV